MLFLFTVGVTEWSPVWTGSVRSIDVITNFAVITNVFVKSVLCTMYLPLSFFGF